MPTTPTDLWTFAKQLASEGDGDWQTVLDPVGLLHSDGALRYDSTPTNCEVFASTGGEGVHFGVLGVPDRPIVMVVPMAFDNEHVIVGGDLHEFLCLGCECGYFGLERLVYGWSETVEWIKGAGTAEQDPTEQRLLRALRERFELQALPYPGERLRELQRVYRSQVVVVSEE